MSSTHVFRQESEIAAGARLTSLFERSEDPLEIRLDNFPKYVRRLALKRFLACYEVFKEILPVKGSVVECGVFRGFGLTSWARLSAILEPENLTRRIYGLDTFAGFPSLANADQSSLAHSANAVGDLRADCDIELEEWTKIFDADRLLGHIPKVSLVKGDITVTAPQLIRDQPHLVVSLLVLDADLYEPTLAALRAFVPRMPAGAVIAFDELDNPKWPGETLAALESIGLNRLRLRRQPWDPYLSYAVIDQPLSVQ